VLYSYTKPLCCLICSRFPGLSRYKFEFQNLAFITDHHHGEICSQHILPRPRVYTDHHHRDTYVQDVLQSPRCIQIIILETHMVMTYCQVQGYIQFIMETWSRHITKAKVYTDHHQGDTYVQDVLLRPRVHTDHHGDTKQS